MAIRSINPHDQSRVGELDSSTASDVESAVAAARAALLSWRELSIRERLAYIKRYRDLFVAGREVLARLITLEMGKPISQSLREVDGRIAFFDYYLQKSEENLVDEIIENEHGHKSIVVFEPLGVVAVIAPWNYPTSAITAGVVPALVAGNTVVFKPSEHSTLSQKFAIDLILRAGIPEGVVSTVVGDGEVGEMLVDSPVDMIWFTGSTKVGEEIYRRAGEKFIKCVCEMGGSSAGIIFDDADIDRAVEGVYASRFINSGQLCNATKRLFVQDGIYDTVLKKLTERLQNTVIGDPLGEVDFGPLVSRAQLETIEQQVADAIELGACTAFGGARPSTPEHENGNYFTPTILTGVTCDMRVMREEVFGPVLPIIRFSTEAEALIFANDSEYGLSAEIFTSDMERAERLARKIESGLVLINGRNYARTASPIGGYKKSGIGRQYGKLGMREFAQTKLIAISK